jgi:uncharacterized protein (TIGR02246 family)
MLTLGSRLVNRLRSPIIGLLRYPVSDMFPPPHIRNQKMKILAQALCVLFALAATPAIAGPAEEASAVVDQWAATYSANDRDALVKLYAPDALLLGTTDPVAHRGSDAIRGYFAALEKSDRRNTIREKNVIVLGENAVVVAGFYDFARKEQNYEPRPQRFTFVVVKRDGKWMIAHHHSSPRLAQRQQ